MKVKSINAAFLRSAMVAAATKDVRYYLNGIYFDVDNKRIVGTDGHMLYVAKGVAEMPFTKNIILEHFKVPASAEAVHIEHLKDNRYEVNCYNQGNPIGASQLVKSIDGCYPDYLCALPALDVAVAGGMVATTPNFKERLAYCKANGLRESEEVPEQPMPVATDVCFQLALLGRAAKIMPFARFDFIGRGRVAYLTDGNHPNELVAIMPAKAPTNYILKTWRTELA